MYSTSCPTSITNLDALASPLIILAQHRPPSLIRLDKRELQLGAQHPEARLFSVDRSKELIGILVALVIHSRQVELDLVRGELNDGTLLVDLLQVEGDVDGGGGLVEIVPVARVVVS